jgi:hypothetical protein
MSVDKASGYFQYFDPISGNRTEGETRTCVHCGYTWIYDPRLNFRRKLGLKTPQPVLRGTCTKCSGLVCALPACLKKGCVPLAKQLDDMEKTARKGTHFLLG